MTTPLARRATHKPIAAQLTLAASALALASACGGAAPAPADVESAESAVTGTRADRSLVVVDPAILARFPFSRTIDALRATAVGQGQALAATETRAGVFQRWMRSFDVGTDGCDRPTIDPNDYGLRCPRTPEAKLANVNPFPANARVQFVPVGLFNRFDLMPNDGSTCGEYRVVYAMRLSPGAPLSGRGFIIFEAALPNPNPSAGVDGCLPIAQFWQGLTNDADVNARADKLDAFYYAGTAVPGAVPVIRAANYGLRTPGGNAQPGRPGQVRTNMFIDSVEWQLREFKLETTCPTPTSCTLAFAHETVKVNPAEELFAGTHPKSAAFVGALPSQVASLAATDANGVAMTVRNDFNEFESVSQATNLLYRNAANATARAAIQTQLTQLGSTLTVDNILDRATTQTCGGCHQLSNNARLGGGLVWPPSRGFVHIDEQSALSAALTTTFIPHRLRVLEAFITARETVGATDQTIAGRPLDAPN